MSPFCTKHIPRVGLHAQGDAPVGPATHREMAFRAAEQTGTRARQEPSGRRPFRYAALPRGLVMPALIASGMFCAIANAAPAASHGLRLALTIVEPAGHRTNFRSTAVRAPHGLRVDYHYTCGVTGGTMAVIIARSFVDYGSIPRRARHGRVPDAQGTEGPRHLCVRAGRLVPRQRHGRARLFLVDALVHLTRPPPCLIPFHA
jgi:hypothetical protein